MVQAHLEHPVETVAAFSHRRHLNKFYRRENLPDNKALGDCVVSTPDEGLIVPFAREILAQLNYALENEGVTEYTENEKVPIKPWFLRAIALRDAHGFPSYDELVDRLSDEAEIAQTVFANAPKDTYSGNYIGQQATTAKRRAIHTGDDQKEIRQVIKNAAHRSVEASYRFGLPIPAETVEKYNLDMSSTVEEADISWRTRRYARWNWVEEIIDVALEPIDFDRNSNWSHPVESVFGILAQSARADESVTEIREDLPIECSELGPRNINETIGTLSKGEIQEQFEKSQIALINFAKRTNIVTGGQSIAFDPTHVMSRTNDERPTVDTGNGRAYFYPISAIVDRQPRLILGAHLIHEKDMQTKMLLRDINKLLDVMEIDELYIDGDFHDSDAIKYAKRDEIKTSIIRCNPARLEDDDFQIHEIGGLEPYHDEIWQSDVAVDDEETDLVWYKRLTEDGWELLGFLTPQLQEEYEAKEIYDKYNKRSRIETTFKQLKNPFRPGTQPEQTEVELFYMQTTVLFYNIYVLMNSYYSPRLLLQLDPSPRNVLRAISDVCLDCGENPT